MLGIGHGNEHRGMAAHPPAHSASWHIAPHDARVPSCFCAVSHESLLFAWPTVLRRMPTHARSQTARARGPRIRHLVQHNVAALKRVITLLVLDTLLFGSKPPTALRASHFRSRLVRCMRKMQRRTDALRLCRAVSTVTLPVMLPHTMLVPCLNNELEQRKAQLAELSRLPVLQGHIHGRSKKAFFGRHVANKTPRARCPCT